MNRKEAIALLVELGSNQLVNPDYVVLEEINPDIYQLKIKGNYTLQEIGSFLKDRFLLKEINGFLIIFKP